MWRILTGISGGFESEWLAVLEWNTHVSIASDRFCRIGGCENMKFTQEADPHDVNGNA
jgi:hypothetical protein